MNNRRAFLTLFFSIIYVLAFAQNEQQQKLLTLLSEGRYFESRDLYNEIHDTLDFDEELYYEYWMCKFMNRKDSAAICLEKMLEDYPEFVGNGAMSIYIELFNIYTDLKDKEKGVYTYKRVMEYLKDNPYGINEEDIPVLKKETEERFACFKQLVNEPPIKLRRKKTSDSLKIEGKDKLWLNAKFNGFVHKALFDIGGGTYCTMSRNCAEKIGVKYNTSKIVKKPFNNTDMQIIMDSIEIGDIVLYNIPIQLLDHDISQYLPDSIKNDSIEMEDFDSVKDEIGSPMLGLPMMQLIGRLLIDYENNTISFPDIHTKISEEPNLFFYNGVYMHAKLNKQDFIGQLDTGADSYIEIDSVFYEKHKNDIPIDTMTVKKPYNLAMFHHTWVDMPYQIPDNLKITFDNKQISPPSDDENPIRIYSIQPIWSTKIFDGVIGYDFFKKIGKRVLLDLDNMRLEAIE
jgi:hypothetical protein